MPVITKISVQKHNAERYNIFLDGQYRFSVDEEVLARFQLLKGKELDELDIESILAQDDVRKGVNTAIQFLSYRMRSEKEVRDDLRKKEFGPEVIREVILKLYEMQYLDDAEFAASFVRTQMNTTHKGLGVIERELRQKGIAPVHIEKALQAFNTEKQVDHALVLAQKLAKKHAKLSEKILKQKVEQGLLRKGYPSGIIRMAMDELHIVKDEEEEWAALQLQAEKAQRKYGKLPGAAYEQKMKQALYRKGFPLDLIDRYLREQQE
ncbi:recombination regulator RecX [Heyndrickxia acidiproducens]|uniref:recombination regulator RecX n=1 Tax=Heyndrickxia acidiproducens TaxID=1121084 RepID=UPI0003662CBC|nr:recombination regulator RecX [Heyndrickxia acidiproducens]